MPQVLMLSGADRDLRDGAGRTPIALAAAAGQEECVEGAQLDPALPAVLRSFLQQRLPLLVPLLRQPCATRSYCSDAACPFPQC